MVISQLAAMELAETGAQIERPFRHVIAWLRRAQPRPARMFAVMPGGGEIVSDIGGLTRGERTAVDAAADATSRRAQA